jgi:hypothetical protein
MPYVMLTILTTNDALPNYSLTSVFRTGELKDLAPRLNAMRDHAKVKSSAPAITSGAIESGVPTQSSAVASGAVESNVATQDEPLAKATEHLAQAVTRLQAAQRPSTGAWISLRWRYDNMRIRPWLSPWQLVPLAHDD